MTGGYVGLEAKETKKERGLKKEKVYCSKY
jgi:hypothetical protein